MQGSGLPSTPDFKAIEAAALESSQDRQEMFLLIGNLVFSWSNNESLLIYVIMLLLRTDAASAALIFGTLNTTRARIELVRRLAKANLNDEDAQEGLRRILKWFEAGTKVRNEFNHSMFVVSDSGEITHTHALRVEDRNGRISFGEERVVDERRRERLRRSIGSMGELNKALWAFLPRLDAAMRRDSGTGTQT